MIDGNYRSLFNKVLDRLISHVENGHIFRAMFSEYFCARKWTRNGSAHGIWQALSFGIAGYS
jgi:hypothetical protein